MNTEFSQDPILNELVGDLLRSREGTGRERAVSNLSAYNASLVEEMEVTAYMALYALTKAQERLEELGEMGVDSHVIFSLLSGYASPDVALVNARGRDRLELLFSKLNLMEENVDAAIVGIVGGEVQD